MRAPFTGLPTPIDPNTAFHRGCGEPGVPATAVFKVLFSWQCRESKNANTDDGVCNGLGLRDQPCGGCQRGQGQSRCGLRGLPWRSGAVLPNAPNLAGQPEIHLTEQLKNYRSGKRTHAVMSVIAKPLSDKEIDDLSAWYASLQIEVREGK